ncbi:SHC-transforming protein 1-like [Lingula anatina]|uniref:SHC-transforming protein 1-like n=1 Tax=Lingula anatina TaxID=7574 RepID=A0A1S3HF27_LINAN|nr:SHC-transforming protein 1-like [Lingula anatina]|eukprot:XP_013384635.1 SHC-transforming protein 1-like [Lingula anatina]
MDKLLKKGKPPQGSDWSKTGTFINKPTKGWLHPDDQLSPEAGVCYGLRYVGCMEVRQSMRTLDFETRTAVAKESISRVCDAAGLKTATKKKKDKKLVKILGEHPKMIYAGTNVNLTITTDALTLMIMDTGEILVHHEMPGISFASGGDPDTMDFVAYVAKDSVNGRACHILECGGGLAQDVITTMGQAFELRFKEFLRNQPKAMNLPDKLESPVFSNEESAWGDDPDYYNDRPGAVAPDQAPPIPPLPVYSAPKSNQPKMDKLLKKGKPPQGSDWSKTGTFINKPTKGWLHPDDQLSPEAGVCYGLRYVGCMEVRQSMRTLDFETRTAVAKESISRVCDAAGLKTATKKKKDKKLVKILGEHPKMIYAGTNVNLTITTDALTLMIMDTGEILVHHEMPGISFASGGDPDTMDFVAYVAKDSVNGRACHILECGGGLAQDVITTMGQAFELRFKEFLRNQPKAMNLPDKLESPVFSNEESAWGDDPDYYNDRPGAVAPDQAPPIPPLPVYSAPKSNQPVDENGYSSVKFRDPVYDNKDGAIGLLVDLSEPQKEAFQDDFEAESDLSMVKPPVTYDNLPNELAEMEAKGAVGGGVYDNHGATSGASKDLDPFDMKPFKSSLSGEQTGAASGSPGDITPKNEEWFHGALTRQQAEEKLKKDGDFLVRESKNSPGQYILSGMRSGHFKHLMLVDPNGVVRTRDRTFDSISHLVNYHMTNKLPIMSQESELLLKRPVVSLG